MLDPTNAGGGWGWGGGGGVGGGPGKQTHRRVPAAMWRFVAASSLRRPLRPDVPWSHVFSCMRTRRAHMAMGFAAFVRERGRIAPARKDGRWLLVTSRGRDGPL